MRWWLVVMLGSGLVASGQGQNAMAVTPLPVFDVVSVKPHPGGPGNWDLDERDGKFVGTDVTLRTLMSAAYGVREGLIYFHGNGSTKAGGAADEMPGWVSNERFDVLAKVSDADLAQLKKLTDAQNDAMLRVALEDRFRLKVHKETRTLPVYDLVVVKTGMKLTPVRVTTDAEVAAGAEKSRGSLEFSQGRLEARTAGMEPLVAVLAEQVNRTVIDQTGLTGKYDFTLKFLQEGRPETPDSPPDLFTALEEQLGLKLKADRGPVEVLVVDAVAKPTEN